MSSEPIGQPTDSQVTTAEQELPEFTLKNVLGDIKYGIWSAFMNPIANKPMAMALLFAESTILKLISSFVPYTEIDYSSYMQQIQLIESGELDYAKIKGDTGPIVYPGGHVYFYSWMNFITEGLYDMVSGQIAFRYLYLLTLLFVFVIYLSSGGVKGKFVVKPYQLYLICASRRLHSIYVLRLFNDCFTTFFMVATIMVLQQASYYKKSNGVVSGVLTYLSADLFSVAVSVKMNALLYLPGYLLVVYFLSDENVLKMIPVLFFGLLVQVGMNWSFISGSEEIRKNFLNGAFNFKRTFMYEWTVNWKFLDENVFQSESFHNLLLVLHVSVLCLFLFKRWLSPTVTGKPLKQFLGDSLKFYKSTISPNNVILSEANGTLFVALVMTLSNLIGVLFSRSLHYQFLAWYSFSLPFLLSFSNMPAIVNVLIFGAHEWCWNNYPSDWKSSLLLVCILAFVVGSNFVNDVFVSGEAEETEEEVEEKKSQ